jgi:hypothetical protein
MAFAHQDLDIRPIPGVAPFEAGKPGSAEVADAKTSDRLAPDDSVHRPGVISRRTAATLGDIGTLFDQATPSPGDDRRASIDSLGRTVSTGGSITGGGVSFSGGKWSFR